MEVNISEVSGFGSDWAAIMRGKGTCVSMRLQINKYVTQFIDWQWSVSGQRKDPPVSKRCKKYL